MRSTPSVLATQVFHALRDNQATQGEQQPADAPDLNDTYAAALRNLTAATWRVG
jgi:hypothetical protein